MEVITCRLRDDHGQKTNDIVAVVRHENQQFISFAACSQSDHFDKRKGKLMAVGRATKMFEMWMEQRNASAEQLTEIVVNRQGLVGKVAWRPFPCPENQPVSFDICDLDGDVYSTIHVPRWMLTPKEEKK